jgi:hypothetical protein
MNYSNIRMTTTSPWAGPALFPSLAKRWAFLVAVLAMLALAGCANKEPEQRKVFITFLQTRIIDKKGVHYPIMNAQDKQAVGPYAAHYEVIANFNLRRDEAFKAIEDGDDLQRKLRNMQGLQNNWQELGPLSVKMAEIGKTLTRELQKTQAARDALKQPDDLKTVYDQAFAKTVTTPAQTVQNMLPTMEKTFQAMEALGRFLSDNKARIKISGMTVEMDDEALLTQFQQLQNEYMAHAQALIPAVQALNNQLH